MSFLSRLTVTILLTTFPVLANAASSARAPYKGAIIVEAQTGKVIFEDKSDFIAPPASITKLMTFLIVHDRLKRGIITLQTPVPVSAASSRIGGTQVWLKHGETFPVEEMLYALMIQSANDCAHALATTIAGTPSAFIELMNERARQLGMTNTTFRSPHGLPPSNRRIADGDLTTPRDLALLSRHLLLHTNILKYTSIKVRAFRDGQTKGRIVMRNHNHLLGRVAGVDGLKTGYTRGAGFCLAATASRHGRRIIVVSMGSPSAKIRDIKMAELIEKGFAEFPITDSPLMLAPLPSTENASSPIELSPPTPTPTPKPQEEPSPVIKFSIPSS